ncbi:MAG: 2-amino-4-oxopentanoate thiolase subunit OrtA [Bacillota bacterium]|nr:2-amino-4-oxopentanoate thiolase subunit OrtA [Bacillota bacterium]
MVKKGQWVQIHKVILKPGERAPQVPEDTAKVPLEMWCKGYLQQDGEPGQEVEIVTVTGRRETGTLLGENPCYRHDYGEFVPELLEISRQVRELTFGGDGK